MSLELLQVSGTNVIINQELISEQIRSGQINKNIFDSAYQQIFDLLKFSVFPRFTKYLGELKC